MEEDKPLPDCREVFNIVDKDRSGFITRDELAEMCSSPTGSYSTSLLDSVMASLDADNDGQISFEEFQTGFDSYRRMDTSNDGAVCSTPRPLVQSEEIFESEPLLIDDNWTETADRIDPHGLLKGTGVDKMWQQVCSQEPHLLEEFEQFLSEVVVQLDLTHKEKHTLQQRVKKMLASHNREVHEMDELLEKHISQAEESKRTESARKTARLSTHYNSLLEEREAMIEQMTQAEDTLKKTLDNKVQNERELTQERNYLLSANEELRQQLSISNDQQISINQQQQDGQQQQQEQQEAGQQQQQEQQEAGQQQQQEQQEEAGQQQQQQQQEAGRQQQQQGKQQQLNLASFDGSEDHVKYFPPKKASFSSPEHWKTPHSTADSLSTPNIPTSTTSEANNNWAQGRRTNAEHVLSRDVSISVSNWIPPPANNTPHSTSTSPLNRVFKVVFLGNSGVGKSSLILRLCEGQFTTDTIATIGLDFYTKLLTVGEEQLVFQLWDTAGQERFHNALTPVYFRRADAFVIVYDVTDKKSFKSTKSWISIITTALRQHPPVLMIVGNKSDQSSKERQVTAEEGRALALEQQALFSEMSALSGDNVLQGHTTLAQLLLARENADLQAFKVHSLKLSGAPTKKCRC